MIKPIEDRILIKIIESQETTKSGILLGNSMKDNSQIAEVIEVGEGKEVDGKFEKMYLKKGDKIIFNKYSGSEIRYRDEDYMVLKQDDVLAIIE